MDQGSDACGAAKAEAERGDLTTDGRVPVGAIRALLQIPAATAQRIRDLTPARSRPRPQVGPSADYGEPER